MEKSRIVNENKLHPQRVTIWCAIMCDCITVIIHLRNRHELWFQQDGATCHTVNETMDVLQGHPCAQQTIRP